jgi:hypothetical protein
VRLRLGIDAAPAQLVEERQLERLVQAQPVDDDEEHAAREPRRVRLDDHRRDLRDRRLVIRLLEIEHEVRAGQPCLHRADRAEDDERERRSHDLARRRRRVVNGGRAHP